MLEQVWKEKPKQLFVLKFRTEQVWKFKDENRDFENLKNHKRIF